MNAFEVITSIRDCVGESPVWHAMQKALYWVDIEGRMIRRFHPGGAQAVESWEMPERVGCIALAADGRVLAAMESRIVAVRLDEGGGSHAQVLATVKHPAPGMRFNDGRCDALGRLWVGTMVMDMTSASALGGLYCLDERGLTGPYVEGLITPNGLGFSPDGRALYLSDSHPRVQKIWAFDFDMEAGIPSNRRLFVDMSGLPGRPDGAAVDARGHYWICANDAGQIHEFSPDGRLLRSVSVPMSKPSMCAFGGEALDTLYVTSIIPGAPTLELDDLSGRLVSIQPGARGRAEPFFSRFPKGG